MPLPGNAFHIAPRERGQGNGRGPIGHIGSGTDIVATKTVSGQVHVFDLSKPFSSNADREVTPLAVWPACGASHVDTSA